jgi:hypothetical protein
MRQLLPLALSANTIALMWLVKEDRRREHTAPVRATDA